VYQPNVLLRHRPVTIQNTANQSLILQVPLATTMASSAQTSMANIWRSPNLVYRAFEPSDDDFMQALRSDPTSFIQAAPILPIPQARKNVTSTREKVASSLLGVAICLPAPAAATPQSAGTGGDSVGSKLIPIGLLNLRAPGEAQVQHRFAHLGIFMLAAYQGKGYGTEALVWCLDFAFKQANLHRVMLEVAEINPRARRLYERIGFVVEGVKREHLWFDGRYWDQTIMGILDREWRAKREAAKGERDVVVGAPK
jgi:ribosomal protein S18 acetylase RimI-like enzyme